jgi:hypothetical protein
VRAPLFGALRPWEETWGEGFDRTGPKMSPASLSPQPLISPYRSPRFVARSSRRGGDDEYAEARLQPRTGYVAPVWTLVPSCVLHAIEGRRLARPPSFR